ncbi:unnamed protein product [Sympodiomycopsis kandeliae]
MQSFTKFSFLFGFVLMALFTISSQVQAVEAREISSRKVNNKNNSKKVQVQAKAIKKSSKKQLKKVTKKQSQKAAHNNNNAKHGHGHNNNDKHGHGHNNNNNNGHGHGHGHGHPNNGHGNGNTAAPNQPSSTTTGTVVTGTAQPVSTQTTGASASTAAPGAPSSTASTDSSVATASSTADPASSSTAEPVSSSTAEPSATSIVDPSATRGPIGTGTSSTSAAPSTTSGATAPAGLSADDEAVLEDHNEKRAQLNAPALTWDTTLAQFASQYADQCQFKHSGGPYGENLAAGGPYDSYTVDQLFDSWYNEGAECNYQATGCSFSTAGHYVNLINPDYKKLGCATVKCPGTLFGSDSSLPDTKYLVCEYQ